MFKVATVVPVVVRVDSSYEWLIRGGTSARGGCRRMQNEVTEYKNNQRGFGPGMGGWMESDGTRPGGRRRRVCYQESLLGHRDVSRF
jgi:hypothetical protein